MTTVLLVGKKDDMFVNYFLRRLSSYIYVSLSNVRIKRIDTGNLLIYDTDEEFLDIEVDYDVIIFKNNDFGSFDIGRCRKCKNVFIPGDSKELSGILKFNGIPYETFGLYREDNVTVSSFSEERMSVCIQNPFIDFLGKTVDSGEFIVKGKFNSQSLYASLTGAVVNHILGDSIRKNYNTFSFRLND